MQRRTFVRAAGLCASVAAAAPWRLAVAAGQMKVLKFGQSASLTGGQAGYGKDVQAGILAAFAAANAADTAQGLRYELQTLDDGGVRANTLRNAISLVDSGALALVGLTSGAGAEACLPVVEDSHIPLLGTASGNMGIRAGKVQGAFHVRAGYDAEYQRMVAYVKGVGMQRVGVVYLGDTSRANLDAMTQALSTQAITPVLSLAIDRNAGQFDNVVAQLASAKLACVLFTANATPVARIIEGLRKQGYGGLFYASSFAGQDLLDLLATRQHSCVMSVVVPRPAAHKPGVVAQCQRDLALLGGGQRLGITTLEGYIAGRVAVDAARAALRAGNPSRERVREALNGLRTDLGGYQVAFNGSTQGSRYVDLLALDRYGRLVG